MPVSNSTEHWIKPDALTINLNHFNDPDYLQVSVLAGAVVMAFKQDVIGYNAAHNYRTWPLDAANTYLENTSSCYVYAKLTRSEVNARALVAYDTVLRDIEGREISYAEDGSEILGEADSDLFYIFLGQISSSLDSNGQSILREWLVDFRFGNLNTNQFQNEEAGGEWTKMFRLNKVTDMIDVLKKFSSAVFQKLFIREKEITDIQRSDDESELVADSVIPTTQYTAKTFLRKDKDDRSAGYVASDQGFVVGEFNEGTLGSGASIFEREGNTYGEVDFFKVRKKATFTNITVQELKHVGGEIILSPAAMICSKVEEVENGYKCYFNTEDSDERKVYNEFELDDQARCQTFNLTENTYYWRLVVDRGDDFITLSKDDCDSGSDIPKAGDNISQLGNRTNTERQAAIILSAYGSDAPSYKQYNGIDSYSLVGKQVTKLSPYGNELTGILNIEKGSKGASNLEDFPDEVFKAVHVGAVNLLRNSGFTGDYKTEDLDSNYALDESTELFSNGLKYWEGEATVTDEIDSISGKGVELGSISQTVEVIKDEMYVVSFRAKGTEVSISCGDFTKSQHLEEDAQRFEFSFKSNGKGDFNIGGDAVVYDLQMERGTIATDWKPCPMDNDKSFAEFQSLTYIQNAMREGSSQFIGGLFLTAMMMLGNYKDGKMEKVNAGVSGIYNDDDDVAFWGGGTFEQAIKTIVRFKQNPRYNPSDEEWKDLAKFVVSHGGDAIFKGNVYADNGYFRGSVYADNGYFKGLVNLANDKILLNPDGSGHLADGGISWSANGAMYRTAHDYVKWIPITDFDSDGLINFSKGTYFDITTGLSSIESAFTLPNPDDEYYTVAFKFVQLSRSNDSAWIKGSFSVREGEVYIDVDYIKIEQENEIQLSYDGSRWVYEGVNVVIDKEFAVGETTVKVAYITSTVSTDTEIIAEKVTSNTFVAGGNEGLTQVITINGANGAYKLTYVGGILTAYSFEYDNGN